MLRSRRIAVTRAMAKTERIGINRFQKKREHDASITSHNSYKGNGKDKGQEQEVFAKDNDGDKRSPPKNKGVLLAPANSQITKQSNY